MDFKIARPQCCMIVSECSKIMSHSLHFTVLCVSLAMLLSFTLKYEVKTYSFVPKAVGSQPLAQ